MNKLATAFLTTILATSASAMSYGDLVSKGKISGVATTLGTGVEYSYSVSDKVAARVGYYSASADFDLTDSTIALENNSANISFQSIGVIGDYHPAAGMFRLSAGLINMSNKVSFSGDLTGNQVIGDTTYAVGDIASLTGSTEIGGTLPYFGIGLSKSPSEDGIGASLDIGVAISPEITSSLDVACTDTILCPTLQDDIDKEVAKLQADNAFDLPYWPVLSAGLSYSF